MHLFVLLALTLQSGGAGVASMTPPAAPRQALTPRDSAFHALSRLAYGPRPGEVDGVARLGVMGWIDAQLDPRRIDDRALAEREQGFQLLGYNREDLARAYLAAQRARQERQRAGGAAAGEPADGLDMAPEMLRARRLAAELQELVVVRAVLSERQLREVMVDFWTNHFNVFFGKGADRFLTPSYIEETIRPNALGRFEDLLIATAKSPAMLFYLDNAESVAPGSIPPQLARLERSGLFDPMRVDSLRRRALERMPKGINENYARELMELHTLGVDGGYTQRDVIDVARIFTGWSIDRPQQGAGFAFHEWAHDAGEKTVLGTKFPAGHGMDEGLRLLKLLAAAHATMHHVSAQLCARFVADDPPDGCVDDAVAAWHHSDGDIREVLRAIFHGPDFWAPRNVGTKLKTPLEFVVSAVRAVGAEPDTTPRLALVVARLGEPLYQHVAPDGYPEREDAWVNSGALLARMNAALGLASGKLPGVTVRPDAIAPAIVDADQLIAAIDAQIFAGTLSAHTKRAIRDQLADIHDPAQARVLAIGMALGGPEFQRQ
jgi:uncharacterized protein (DUF1800 family)